jgi:hypothetical protein
MTDEQWIEKNSEGNGRGIIEILLQKFPGGTEEKHAKPQAGMPVSRPKFEPGTSGTQSPSGTARRARSVSQNISAPDNVLATALSSIKPICNLLL